MRLWNRLILMPEDRLVKRVLCWDWEICHNNWCADVKEILEELELEYCFNEMCPGRPDELLYRPDELLLSSGQISISSGQYINSSGRISISSGRIIYRRRDPPKEYT